MMVPPRIKIGSQSDPLYLMLVLFVAQGRFPLEIRRVIDCFLLLPTLILEVLALFVKKKCVFPSFFLTISWKSGYISGISAKKFAF